MAKVAKHTIKHGGEDGVTTFSPGDEVKGVDGELVKQWEADGLVADESDSSDNGEEENRQSEREKRVETAKQQKQEQEQKQEQQ